MKVTIELTVDELNQAIALYLNQNEKSPFLGMKVPTIKSVHITHDARFVFQEMQSNGRIIIDLKEHGK